jgi:hypothetical protein
VNARLIATGSSFAPSRPQMPACPRFCQRHDINAQFGEANHYGPETSVPIGDDGLSAVACRDDRDGRVGEPHVYLSGLDDVSVELTAEQARQLGLALIDASVDVASATRSGAR